jgi:hypothetical protein
VSEVSEVSKVSKVSGGGKREAGKIGSWEDREEGKGGRQETEGEKDGRKELLIVNEKRRGEGGIVRQLVSGGKLLRAVIGENLKERSLVIGHWWGR